MVFLAILGLAVGVFSGLLGVGGGVLIVPALTFLPPLWGMMAFPIHGATGISAVQGFFGGLTSLWTHYRRGAVHPVLVWPLVLGSLVGGISGGVVSGFLPDLALYMIFALILLTTLVFAFTHPGVDEHPESEEELAASAMSFPAGILIGGGISFISAQIGIGGAILLLPILIFLKGISTRVAIGTGAGFVVVTAMSASIGKLMVNLVPFPEVIWVSAGSLLGGTLGARLSHHMPPRFLRTLMLVVIIVTLIRVSLEIFRLYIGASAV